MTDRPSPSPSRSGDPMTPTFRRRMTLGVLGLLVVVALVYALVR
ncbi:MAG TPA: hypothetical protein VFL46_08475 [Phycicoccus sp.]|nr:hypothetical protein [Phycicoccus sp.]